MPAAFVIVNTAKQSTLYAPTFTRPIIASSTGKAPQNVAVYYCDTVRAS
jgi:hypothetical protein